MYASFHNTSTAMESLSLSLDAARIHPLFFAMENQVALYEWQEWCVQRGRWPIGAVLLYLVLIVWGKEAMRERKAFHMKHLLCAWNTGLALFSAVACLRLWIPIIFQLKTFGFTDSICVNRPDNVVSLWIFLFTMSKFVELGDTMFLVLRKRRVMLLHWFHHVTVLLYTWFAFTHNAPTGKYFVAVNLLVHSVMYSYYALQCVGVRAPRGVSMSITLLQLSQMLLGIALLVASMRASCGTDPVIMWSGVAMYSSYFGLFLHFFLRAYFFAAKNVAAVPAQKREVEHVKSH